MAGKARNNDIAFEMIAVVAAGFYSGIVQSPGRHRGIFFLLSFINQFRILALFLFFNR